MPNPSKRDDGVWEATHKDGSVTEHPSRTAARNFLKGAPSGPGAGPTDEAPEHLIGGDIPPAGKAKKTKVESKPAKPAKVKAEPKQPVAKTPKEPVVAPNKLEGLDGSQLTSELLKLATTKLAGPQELYRQHGMTNSQVEVLLALGDKPVTQKYLSQTLDCTGGNITLVLDNLQKKGLAERERNPEDRRAMNVTLTKGGVVIAKVFAEAREVALASIFGSFEEKDVKALNRLLKRLVGDE